MADSYCVAFWLGEPRRPSTAVLPAFKRSVVRAVVARATTPSSRVVNATHPRQCSLS